MVALMPRIPTKAEKMLRRDDNLYLRKEQKKRQEQFARRHAKAVAQVEALILSEICPFPARCPFTADYDFLHSPALLALGTATRRRLEREAAAAQGLSRSAYKKAKRRKNAKVRKDHA